LSRAAVAILGLGATLALAGCGTGSVARGGDVTNGKKLFLNLGPGKPSCASCHTLAAAGASGKVGPNLDYAFSYARLAANKGDRFDQSTIENVVLDQIRFPSQNNLEPQYVMPANLVKGKDAVDVAAYVASVAGKPIPGVTG
jgi:mono/diheme cytochrome c family protein